MNYQGTGNIELFGCNLVKIYYYADNRYNIGDLLYLKPKALVGILENIVIKNILVNGEYPYFITYIDTFNSLWNEDELILLEDANNLIFVYNSRKNALALNKAKAC